MTASDTFDLPALQAICADWPNVRVQDLLAADSLMDRIRQVLQGMQRDTYRGGVDIVPLIRHILLRQGVDGAAPGWLRVPTTPGWPDEAAWRDAHFYVDPVSNGLNVSPHFPRLAFLGEQSDLFDDAFCELDSRPRAQVDGDPFLQRSLGLPSYTGDGQREAVRAMLHLPPGETLIANLPTGSGKSLLAQLPPLLNAEGMLTLVVVPTVALALDQERRMRPLLERRFPHKVLPPLAYHAGITQEERASIRRAIIAGEQPILFTSPEGATTTLRAWLESAAAAGRISDIVVDEAHLVTGWGNGFRPVFQLLPALVHSLRRRAADRPIRVALASATLSEVTLSALRQLFGSSNPTYLVSAVHLRPEPRYAFVFSSGESQKIERTLEAINLAPRPFILYVTRPDEATEWLARLYGVGFTRVAAFTGRTPSTERDQLLSSWAANELDGMVATSAFGLGVDKNDVRTVLHATLPESLDRYYQEVGRGGRDGRASASVLTYTLSDIDQAKGMATEKFLRDESAYDRWTLMISHAVQGESDDVYWVDLNLVPSHLYIKSERNSLWNVRTITMMARAGLIELVDLREGTAAIDEAPIDLSLVSQAAVRLLDANHRDPEVFSRRLAIAREAMLGAGERGVRAMHDVAKNEVEISEALTLMYSVQKGGWSPVVSCCGGCVNHWAKRSVTGRYPPVRAGRLRRFAARDISRIERLGLPMASARLLIVAVADDGDFLVTCQRLATYLASIVRPHTWQLETSLATTRLGRHLRTILRDAPHDDSFIDVVDADAPDAWSAGSGEVRVTFLDRADRATFPKEFWGSDAALEIVIVKNTVGDPDHDQRRFVDTTPHVASATFFEKISL